MALVSDIYWVCPGCGSRETAQVYRDYEDPPEFPLDAIPVGYDLSWNPPCEKCGEYELRMPKTIKLEIKPVNNTIDGSVIDKEKEKIANEFLERQGMISAAYNSVLAIDGAFKDIKPLPDKPINKT